MLRAVSGLLKPSAGRILLDGEDITGLSPDAVLGSGVTQVPQSNGLFPTLTVRENILMGAYIIRRQRALVRQRYDEVLDMFPLVRDKTGDPLRQPVRRPAPHGRVRPFVDARPQAGAARRAVLGPGSQVAHRDRRGGRHHAR